MTDRRRGDPGAGPARGRHLRLRRVRHRRRHAAGAGAGGGRDHHDPGRAGDLRAAGAGCAGPAGRAARSATARSTSTGWSGGSRSASAATASRSTSTPTSSTAPGARTCRSPASPAWPRRRASPPGCSTRCSAPACSAAPARPPTPGRSSSTSRARTCSSSTTRTPGSTPTPAARTPGSAWTPAPFPDVCVYAPPRAGDRTGAPDVASRLTGVDAFYWTVAEFCADRLLPYVFADADDDRQQYTMVVHAVAAYLHRHAEPADGGVVLDGRRVGSYPDLVDLHRGASVRRGHPRRVGRLGGRPGHGQRVPAPADLQQARPVPADPRRPAHRRAGTASTPPRAPRSPWSTCTTCPTGRSGSWSA